MCLQENERNMQIVSKVVELELYNKMVQTIYLIFFLFLPFGSVDFCFHFHSPSPFFSHHVIFSWKNLAAWEIIYSSGFVSGKNHLTVYSRRVKSRGGLQRCSVIRKVWRKASEGD
jgi:hypothetical protein